MRKLVLLAGACLLLLVPVGCSKSDGGGSSATIPLSKVDASKLKEDSAGYRAALAKGLTSGTSAGGDLVMTDKQATCVADAWIPILKVERLRSKKVTVEALQDPKFGYSSFGLTDDEAMQMVDALGACKVDTKTQMAVSLAGGKEGKASACIHDKVDDALMDKVLVSALTNTQPPKDLDTEVGKIVRSCGVS